MGGFSTLADIEAFEKKPLEERNLPESTYAAIRRTAETYPDDTALFFFLQGTAYQQAVHFTYRQWLGKLHQTANMLHDLGLRPGETVSYILPNLPQTYLTLYGGEAAGIANPINPLLEPAGLAEIMNAAQTKILVTLAPLPKTDIWEKVASIADNVPTLQTILQVDIADYLHGVKRLAVGLMRLGKGKEKVRARVLNFDKTMVKYPADRLISGRVIERQEIASYFHTGGTTGAPKLAMHTHFNEVYDAWMGTVAVDVQRQERMYLGLPLFHNYGAIAVGLGAWMADATLVMGTPQGFRGEGVIPNLWKIIDHYKVNSLGAVPTLFKALLNVPVGDADISSLQVAICGSAPLPVELARQFTAQTGVNILEGYGLTEGTSVSAVNPRAGEPRIGSIGLRYPYQEMRIAQLDGERFVRFCAPDEIGTVILRGPNVFPGYKDEFHNRSIFIDNGDGKGRWLNTGDLGYQDEDGFFWLTGRQKELIIRGGHNIDPRQIEEPMHRHPAVALAAAVGRPDARVGELPVVYVELKAGATATAEELLEFARANIAEQAAIPKQIRIVEHMPLTAVGKIAKLPLAYEQIADVIEQELTHIDGIANHSVEVVSDRKLELVSKVQVAAMPGVDAAKLEEQVRQALGQYPVRIDLQVSNAA
ncbi:MAG: acyl-CoA synthetase [Caldilinea sp.]